MESYLVIDKYRAKRWYNLKLELHRDEDLPAIVFKDGTKFYYANNKCHRGNGAAREYSNGSRYWYYEGKLHRIDGPAYEGSHGEKAWWYEGERIKCTSQEEFLRILSERGVGVVAPSFQEDKL